MASEDLREYLEAARQRRVHEQDARKQEMAARHEARRRDFEARSEPLNVHVVRVLEGARADLAEAGAKLEYKFHSYNAGKQLENPRVEFQIAGVGSPGTASSVYVIEIVQVRWSFERSEALAIQTLLSRPTDRRREQLLP
jgi:hypothetical protein